MWVRSWRICKPKCSSMSEATLLDTHRGKVSVTRECIYALLIAVLNILALFESKCSGEKRVACSIPLISNPLTWRSRVSFLAKVGQTERPSSLPGLASGNARLGEDRSICFTMRMAERVPVDLALSCRGLVAPAGWRNAFETEASSPNLV
jgi:hypothetical protein